MILRVKYKKGKEGIDYIEQTLPIPHKITIRYLPYTLKAVVLRHLKSNGEPFYSVLLTDGILWYHQLNHMGKVVNDIDTVLNNKNRNFHLIMYENSVYGTAA